MSTTNWSSEAGMGEGETGSVTTGSTTIDTNWTQDSGMTDVSDAEQANIVELVERAETAAINAETAETNSETAETNAETAQAAAETAKTGAETAQTAAETAQTAAEAAQTAAETAETNAETAEANTLAIFGDAQDVQDAVDSASASATTATTKATEAASSATNAATSATNASTSATSASASATASATSASTSNTSAIASQTAQSNAEAAEANAIIARTAAESAESNAETSATQAASSATSASSSASQALSAKTDAETAQSAAATSAFNANTSETNAATSETNASTSETNAASSATAAASSATSAASSATDAEAAQTAAESAQASAEAVYDSFDDRYLGSKSADPTLDNDGDALAAGALYFNTTENEMRVYTGSAWEPVQELSGDQTVNSLTSNNDVVVKGNLEVQGTTITVDSATAQTIDLGDNDKIRLGDGDDFQIYHDGTDSYIANTTGTLKLSSNTDVTGNITVSGTVDGRDIAADGTTLDAVASTYVDVSGDTMTGSLNFNDSVQARYGASGDLRIYHDGSHSYISDQGPGNLRLVSNGNSIRLETNYENMLIANNNSSVDIYYDGAKKFATTSSGVDITGTVVADGLTVSKGSGDIATLEGTGTVDNVEANLVFNPVYDVNARIVSAREGWNLQSRLTFETGSDNTGSTTPRLNIGANGDISFYEDTGTTAKLTWDASAEELQFKDGVAAEFGDGGDFQIEHNGTNTKITNNTGTLKIVQNVNDGDVEISSDDGSGATALYFVADGSTGEAILYHYGSQKLATKSTGIDVTGTVTADGLTVESAAPSILINETDATDLNTRFKSNSGQLDIQTFTDAGASAGNRISINHNNGDISFYDDSGTSQDFYWDASLSRLGLGTTSPDSLFHISSGGPKITFTDTTFNADATITVNDAGSLTFSADANNERTNSRIQFDVDGSEAMRIDSSGNVGIGTTTPNYNLEITELGNPTLLLNNLSQSVSTDSVSGSILFMNNDASTPAGGRISGSIKGVLTDAFGRQSLIFGTGTSNPKTTYGDPAVYTDDTYSRLGITWYGDIYFNNDDATSQDFYWDASTSRLGLGTTSPANKLDIVGGDVRITDTYPALILKDSDLSDVYAEVSAGNGNLVISSDHLNNQASSNTAFWVDGSERMRIDSSGRLGIGVSSLGVFTTDGDDLIVGDGASARGITINSGASSYGNLYFADPSSTNIGYLRYYHGDNSMRISTNGSEAMRIDSSGRLGIGTTNPQATLQVSSGSDYVRCFDSSSRGIQINQADPILSLRDSDATGTPLCDISGSGGILSLRADASNETASSAIQFTVDGSEAARIDSSGNLLVGTTSTTVGSSSTLDGIALLIDGSGGTLTAARSGTVARLNRQSSDGEIINFRKDGSTVGSIGTADGDLYVGTGDTGIKFNDFGNQIRPTNSGATKDAAIDLGADGHRFKDLFLSGGVYLGGTGSANLLDDYEEGTWTPAIQNGTFTYNNQNGKYVIVGRMILVNLVVKWTAKSGTGNLTINLPFTALASSPNSRFTGSLGYTRGVDFGGKTQLTALYSGGDSVISIYQTGDNSQPNSVLVENCDTVGELMVTAVYQI